MGEGKKCAESERELERSLSICSAFLNKSGREKVSVYYRERDRETERGEI